MTGFAWRNVIGWRKFSAEEAGELAHRVAELSKSGLPLGSGLRALAEELPGRRLSQVIRGLADRLDSGNDLVAALESEGQSLPAHFRGLILAGVRSGHLPEVLEEFADIERSRMEMRRRIWISLAYPVILMAFMAGLAVLAHFYLIDAFKKVYEDFGTSLPRMTMLVFQISGPLAWGNVGLVAVFALFPLLHTVMPGARWTWPVLYRVPMIGPVYRWSHLSEFSRIMGLLLEQNVTIPDALRLSAAGLCNAQLARGCQHAAKDVEAGRALSESLAERKSFPPSLIPMLQWGQETPVLADAFRAAAVMFEGRAQAHGAVMQSVLAPLMFLVVLSFFWAFVIVALLLPLLSLIQKLT